MSIAFGEAKTLADFTTIVKNIKSKNFAPLMGEIKKIGESEAEPYSAINSSEAFTKLLLENLQPTALDEEEKNKLLALVKKMKISNTLTEYGIKILSDVESFIFPSWACGQTLEKTKIEQDILKFLNPTKRKDFTKENLKEIVSSLFNNETEKNTANQLLEKLIEAKKKEGKEIKYEAIGVELLFSVFFNAVVVSSITAGAAGCVKKIRDCANGTDKEAERDPENNKFYSAIDVKKASLPEILNAITDATGIAKGANRFANGQERKNVIKKLMALTLVSAGLSPAIAVLSTLEAPFEYLFGLDPKTTTAESGVHPSAGTGGLPKYMFGLFSYCFAMKAKLVESETEIAKAIEKTDFTLEDFNQLVEKGVINNITAIMKFKKTGDEEFKNTLDLLIEKLSEDKKKIALKTFYEKTGLFTDEDRSNTINSGFAKSTSDIIAELESQYKEMEEKYAGYFPNTRNALKQSGFAQLLQSGFAQLLQSGLSKFRSRSTKYEQLTENTESADAERAVSDAERAVSDVVTARSSQGQNEEQQGLLGMGDLQPQIQARTLSDGQRRPSGVLSLIITAIAFTGVNTRVAR